MPQEPVKKAYIQNVATRDIMEFQYNPPEFNDKLGVEYAQLDSPGMSAPMFQYIGGKARSVTFELFLDAYEDPERMMVRTPIAFLHSFVPPADAGKSFSPPPTLIFAWGWFVKRCILNDLDINYTMFDSQLNPIRATVGVTLTILE
jgi:hypothetical protein